MTMAGVKKKPPKFVFKKDANEDMKFEDAAKVNWSQYPEVAKYAVDKFEKEHTVLFAAARTEDERKAGDAYGNFLEAVGKLRETRKGENQKKFPGWVGSDRPKFLGAVQLVNKFILQSLGSKSDDYKMFKVRGLGKWLSKWSFYIWHARTPFSSQYDASDIIAVDMKILEEFVDLIEADSAGADLSVAAMFGDRSINKELFPSGWEQFGIVDGSGPHEDPDKGGIRLVLFTIYVASMQLNEYGEGRIRKACTYYNNNRYLTLLRHFGCLLVAWAPDGVSSLVELQNISNVQLHGKQDSTLYFINNTMYSQKNLQRSNPPNSARIFGFQNLAILVVNRMFWRQMDCKHLNGCENSEKAMFLRHYSEWFAGSNVEEALGLDYALRDWVKLCCDGKLKTARKKRGKTAHEERISNLEDSVATLQDSISKLEKLVNGMIPFPVRIRPVDGLNEFMVNLPGENLLRGTPKTGGTKSRESLNSASSQRKAAPSVNKKKEPPLTKKATQPKASFAAGGKKLSSKGDLSADDDSEDEEIKQRPTKKAFSSTKKAAQDKARSAAGSKKLFSKGDLSADDDSEDEELKQRPTKKAFSSAKKAAQDKAQSAARSKKLFSKEELSADDDSEDEELKQRSTKKVFSSTKKAAYYKARSAAVATMSSAKRRLSRAEDDEPKPKRMKKAPSSNKKAAQNKATYATGVKESYPEGDLLTMKKGKIKNSDVARRQPELSRDSDDDSKDKGHQRIEAQRIPRKKPREELSDDGSLEKKPAAKKKTQVKAQPKRDELKSAEKNMKSGKKKAASLSLQPEGVPRIEDLFTDSGSEADVKAKSPVRKHLAKKIVEEGKKFREKINEERERERKKLMGTKDLLEDNSNASDDNSEESDDSSEESSESSDELEDDGDEPGDESKVLDDKGAPLSSKEKKKAANTDSAQSKSKELRTMQNSREAADDGSVVPNQDDIGKSKDLNNHEAGNDEKQEDDEEDENSNPLQFESSEGEQDDEEAPNAEMGSGDQEAVSGKVVEERSEE